MGARAEERGGSGGHHHRPSVRSAAGRSGGDRDCIFLAGRMIVDALNTRDLQIVQGGILILAATFTIINLITDLVYALLDPRIRYS